MGRQVGLQRLAIVLFAASCFGPLAACGGTDSEADDAVTAKLPPVKEAVQRPRDSVSLAERAPSQAAIAGVPGTLQAAAQRTLASSRYTSLEPSLCELVEGNAQEGGSLRRRCTGAFDYALETSEKDLQQDLAIISPDGQRSELNLSRLVTEARLGKLAEWRGEGSGRPRVLIVRVNGPTNTSSNAIISNLVVARLDAPTCIVAVIAPGSHQNYRARAIADGKRLECMKD